ncbi:MAG TPA: hypothetical protein VKU44_05645 [Terriglobia bacterium]|nr:hypothetical protein [Terriglobia bacterium]
MSSHSSGNGHQTRQLGRELRRAERLAARLDRALALADREVGARGAPAAAAGPGGIGPQRVLMPDGTLAAPLQPVPAPTPGVLAIGPFSAARGGLESTYGASGTPITSGFLLDLGEYNPELAGRNAIPTYEKMRRGDAQVRATLAACKLPIESANWEVVPRISPSEPGFAAAKEIAQFVRANLFGGLEFRNSTGGWSSQTWADVVSNALLMLDFGCAVHEEVWQVDGPVVRLRNLPARLPVTFYRWHTELDGETLLALEQYGYRGGRFVNVTLPADKMALFTYNREGANFWGMALQRAMYPHWFVKSRLYRIDAIACERNALGVPVWRLPPGFSREDRDAAYGFVTQLAAHEATGAVEPPGDSTSGLRIVGYEGRLRDTLPSIEHHNTMISRAALALFMDLANTQHGSRALGQQHNDFFLLSLQCLADQIAAVVESGTVRRLVEFNFGDGAAVPRVVAANVQARSLAAVVDALTQFAQAGLVVSESNLRSFIRQSLALPPEGSRGVVAIRGESVQEGSAEVAGKGAASPDDRVPIDDINPYPKGDPTRE